MHQKHTGRAKTADDAIPCKCHGVIFWFEYNGENNDFSSGNSFNEFESAFFVDVSGKHPILDWDRVTLWQVSLQLRLLTSSATLATRRRA